MGSLPRTNAQQVIGIKWFRKKIDENGFITKNKARLVAKGYSKKEDWLWWDLCPYCKT